MSGLRAKSSPRAHVLCPSDPASRLLLVANYTEILSMDKEKLWSNTKQTCLHTRCGVSNTSNTLLFPDLCVYVLSVVTKAMSHRSVTVLGIIAHHVNKNMSFLPEYFSNNRRSNYRKSAQDTIAMFNQAKKDHCISLDVGFTQQVQNASGVL